MRLRAKLRPRVSAYWSLLLIFSSSHPRARAEVQNPPASLSLQLAEPKANGVLTIDEAVQTALDNNPQLKAARERISTQQAVLGQQMAAYYPSVTSTERYQTEHRAAAPMSRRTGRTSLPAAPR